MEISRTPPSVGPSNLKSFRNVSVAVFVAMGIEGLSSRLSLTTAGLSTKALLGPESLPVAVVTHGGAGPAAFVAVQPEGGVGGVALSKFSVKSARATAQQTKYRVTHSVPSDSLVNLVFHLITKLPKCVIRTLVETTQDSGDRPG